MAFKQKLTKAEYAKLTDGVKENYIADGEIYVIDVEGGVKDEAALLEAKNHEKKKRQEAEKALKDVNAELETLREEREGILKGAIPKGDVDKLEAGYKTKLEKREKELTGTISAREAALNAMLVDSVANNLATKLSKSPTLLAPHIRARLVADLSGEKPATKILDKDGKVSDLSLEAFEKEILANKDFAPILVGSKASGGGANGASGPARGATGKTTDRASFDSMSHLERATFAKEGGQVVDV
jgi:hypothetical protein